MLLIDAVPREVVSFRTVAVAEVIPQGELQSLEVILVLVVLAELLRPQRVPLGPYRLQDRSLGRAEEGFRAHQVSQYRRHLLPLVGNRQSLFHQLHVKGDDVQLQVGNVLAHLQLGV